MNKAHLTTAHPRIESFDPTRAQRDALIALKEAKRTTSGKAWVRQKTAIRKHDVHINGTVAASLIYLGLAERWPERIGDGWENRLGLTLTGAAAAQHVTGRRAAVKP